MAVAFVQEFPIQTRETTNYDAIAERLDASDNPPEGLILHTAGFDDQAGVFRIFDVWETQEQCDRFQAERVMPLVEEIVFAADPGAARPSRNDYYTLHDVIRG
jgi:hypothetical protein